ncbi:hypothetical protein [Halomicrobium salinisoli]|uniref:hypothetical protein n=1 Tax=Halomicrobium salinisoli TaxID=2878391 RepID=UPI001CF06672|nr:hypothetical protein [Halomicrobium salinisoli]
MGNGERRDRNDEAKDNGSERETDRPITDLVGLLSDAEVETIRTARDDAYRTYACRLRK